MSLQPSDPIFQVILCVGEVIKQMYAGNWVDEEGQPVRMNIHMQNLVGATSTLVDYHCVQLLQPTQPLFDDVRSFNQKFGLLCHDRPVQLTERKLKERLEFLFEEFTEFMSACGFHVDVVGTNAAVFGTAKKEVEFRAHDDPDMVEQADALIDLVYVAMGTAAMMGLPWQSLWSDVHRANMKKVRGVSHRGHQVDCIKPDGWVGPRTLEILENFGYNPKEEPVDDSKIETSNNL